MGIFMCKISVIVPVYNVQEYLEQCILSILNQTHREFEIILIDDGSTDDSGLICNQFATQNADRVIVLHQNNQGPLLSRIAGIQKAQGDVVVFVDSDDTLRKDALEIVAKGFDDWNCDMVLFDSGSCPNYQSINISHILKENTIYEGELKKCLYEKLLRYQIPNSVCLKAIKREHTYIDNNFSKFFHVKHGEDLLMSAYFLTTCSKIVYINQGLYHYRARQGSTVHSFDIQRKNSIKLVHTELEKCIDLWGMPQLKPLHNARKVRGWIDTMLMLLKNRSSLPGEEFRTQLKSMAEEPYFRTAYAAMDSSQLSRTYRILAFCLYKKLYFLLRVLTNAAKMVKKMKSGS